MIHCYLLTHSHLYKSQWSGIHQPPAKHVSHKITDDKDIEDKEEEINTLTEKLSDGGFYKSDPDGFVEMTKELNLAKDQLEEYEARWLELEELSQ